MAGRHSSVLALLTLSSALAFGCSGSNDSDNDEEDGDAGENSGGTSGQGGTTARGGGAGVLGGSGGSGSGSSSCESICERANACPGETPVDCAYECAAAVAEVTAAGCTVEYQDYLNCTGALSDVCAFDGTQCASQAQTLVGCLSGSPSCGVGSMPANPSCSAICSRLDACPSATTTCAADCAESETNAQAVGCSVEYQAFMGCASTCADICVLGDYDCISEYDAFYYCVVNYCSANPSAEPCL